MVKNMNFDFQRSMFLFIVGMLESKKSKKKKSSDQYSKWGLQKFIKNKTDPAGKKREK